MTQREAAETRDQINIAVSFNVPNYRAFCALDDKFRVHGPCSAVLTLDSLEALH